MLLLLAVVEKVLEPIILKVAMKYLDRLSSDPEFRTQALEIYGHAQKATTAQEALDASKKIQTLFSRS